jgi:hypothetical protein
MECGNPAFRISPSVAEYANDLEVTLVVGISFFPILALKTGRQSAS